MEDLEKRTIEDLSVVNSVCLHTGDKTHKADVYANLRYCTASSYGGCGAKLVGPIHKSSERPTNLPFYTSVLGTVTTTSWLTCGFIEWMKMPQV